MSWAPAAAGLLLAALLRLIGVNKDLWLDEVWSVKVANEMRSPLQVFQLHHEINHHINTVWLYLVGANGTAAEYHALSLVCGIAAVAVAALIGFRRGPATGLCTMFLVGLSYELIVFSSEARGYAPMVFVALVSFYAVERHHENPALRWIALYAASAFGALLSQPIFASFIASAALWTAVSSYSRERNVRRAIEDALRLHAIPVATLILLYILDLRFVAAGGGTAMRSLAEEYAIALAWVVSAPQELVAEVIAALVVIAAFGVAIRWLYRSGSDQWAFYSGVVVFPIALVLFRRSDYVYTRHFMVAATFLLILFGALLGHWWEKGYRAVVAGVLVAYAALNAVPLAGFAEHGRGQYREAIQYISDQTPGSSVRIAGSQDFRVSGELWYYLPRVMTTKKGEYFELGSWPPGGPDWIIGVSESFEPITRVDPVITDGGDNQYVLMKAFPTAPLTGLNWLLYRNGRLTR